MDPKDIGAKYQGCFGNQKASSDKIWMNVHKIGDAWFRSGDIVRFDKEFRIWFSDRIGDTFRWRSENVSTAEVAQVLGRHPAVVDVNVYGVEIPNHDGRAGCAAVLSQDVMDVKVAVPESVLEDMARFARKELPKYAVLVFGRVVTQTMAATENQKQQNNVLRKESVDPDTVGCGDRIYYLRPGSSFFERFGIREWGEVQGGRIKL